ncbi:uracil-DNA degrading factor [Asbolus verrucosus]|uniref:Uracil-DNA degrading factor n=1 Tax=Asbolus verrucosus TaxID=1661398 RepID=A0A482VSG2_ASBVE|nr:uracil-DNA degrading factor [Asbolus verrucosus]
MSESKPDTVPGLGFKDKEKALETIKNLEGRDPDYQKLAIKGLIGRAKRTLTLTKDKEKLQNINDAMAVFDEWLNNFEKNNLSKENRSYLPLNAIKALLPLKNQYSIEDSKADSFYKAYNEANGEYKNLRTVASGENESTWDIVRNAELKKLLKDIEENRPDLWKDELPTKEHMQVILWAYSPDASKIKKNVSKFEEKLGSEEKESSEESDWDNKGSKRKSDGDEDGSSDESPTKKKKSE